MISRRILTILVTAGCALPVAMVIVLAVARLLVAMHDDSAATVLDRIALATGVVWLVDLACLLLAQGINSLGPPRDTP